MTLGHAYAWDGAEFIPCDFEQIAPSWFDTFDPTRFCDDDPPPASTTAEALAGYARMMRINPRISAYLTPKIEVYSYEIDPHTLERIGPAWRAPPCVARCCYGESYTRRRIIASILDVETKAHIAHELFHTIYYNIETSRLDILERHGDKLREARRGELSFLNYPRDSQSSSWFEKPEEAEAFAFERYATGDKPPFDIELPRAVRRLFDDVLSGAYAHHRCAVRE